MKAHKDEMSQAYDAAEKKNATADETGCVWSLASGRNAARDNDDATRVVLAAAKEGAVQRIANADAETALHSYYRAHRSAASTDAKAAVMRAVCQEALRLQDAADAEAGTKTAWARRMRAVGTHARETLSFVADQARFMGVRAWVLQACVVLLATIFALVGGQYAASVVYVSFASAAIAVCGLPEMFASRLCGIVELERSCKHDARSVAAARMAVMACVNAVGIAIVVAAASYVHADVTFAFVLVCAFAPYCVTVAGCFAAIRRISGSGALAVAVAWGAVVAMGAYFARSYIPWLYEQASLWIWAVAAAGSLAWTLIEARAWLSSVSHSARILLFDSSFINR